MLCVCEGGLSFEVREFFRETTSSEPAPVDEVSPESPSSRRHDDVTSPASRRCHVAVSVEQTRSSSVNTRHQTSSTSCHRDVTPTRTTVTAAAAAAAAGNHDAVDNDGTVRYKQSSSSSPAPSTWIAFKVRPLHSRHSPTFINFCTLLFVLQTSLTLLYCRLVYLLLTVSTNAE